MEEQGAATNDIARNVQQAATGTRGVSSNIEGVSTAVATSSKVLGDVRKSAEDLSRKSAALQREVGKFLAAVKAA